MKNNLWQGLTCGVMIGISLGVIMVTGVIIYFLNQANQQTKLAQEQIAILQTQVASSNQLSRVTAQPQLVIATRPPSASSTDVVKVVATSTALAQVQPQPLRPTSTAQPISLAPTQTPQPVSSVPILLPKVIKKNERYEFERYSLYFSCDKNGADSYSIRFLFDYKTGEEITVKWRVSQLEVYSSTNKKLKLAESPQNEHVSTISKGASRDLLTSTFGRVEFDTSDPEITEIYSYITIESKNIPSGTFGWSCPIPH